MCPDMSSASFKNSKIALSHAGWAGKISFSPQPGSFRAYCKSKKEMNFFRFIGNVDFPRFAVDEVFLASTSNNFFITLQSAPDDVPTR
jgi:hypothetical protein